MVWIVVWTRTWRLGCHGKHDADDARAGGDRHRGGDRQCHEARLHVTRPRFQTSDPGVIL
eukprot:2184671-Rhodomonas_salina.4